MLFCIYLYFCCQTINKHALYIPNNPFEISRVVDIIYNPILILPFKLELDNYCIFYNNNETLLWFNATFTYCNNKYSNNWHNYCNITTNMVIIPLLKCYHIQNMNIWFLLINDTGSFEMIPYCENKTS